jgi:hypothetical protein
MPLMVTVPLLMVAGPVWIAKLGGKPDVLPVTPIVELPSDLSVKAPKVIVDLLQDID